MIYRDEMACEISPNIKKFMWILSITADHDPHLMCFRCMVNAFVLLHACQWLRLLSHQM